MSDRSERCGRIRAAMVGCILSVCLLAGMGRASAQSGKPGDLGIPFDAKALAEKGLKHALETNTAINTAYSLVKFVVDKDPFALVDAIVQLLAPPGEPEISISQARDEIIAEMHKAREEELIADSNSLLSRFEELLDDPQHMLVGERLANYLDDASDLFHQLQLIMRNGDPKRAEIVYHLAPTYNIATSSRIAGLGLAQWSMDSIDRVYVEAITTNSDLIVGPVNGGQGQYNGYLYEHVATALWPDRPWSYYDGRIQCCVYDGRGCTACNGFTLGCAAFTGGTFEEANLACHDNVKLEARARYDSDPIIYSLRRSVSEQQLALVGLH